MAKRGFQVAKTEVVTTPEQQLSWVLDVSGRIPAPDAEIREHVTSELLAAVGGPAGFNALLGRLGRLTLTRRRRPGRR